MLNIHQFTRLLDLAYTKFENIVSEVEFWKPYLQELCEMDDTTSMNDYIRYMCTYVEVLPIEIVAPFMIKIGNNVLRNIAEVKQTQYEYFLNGIR